LAAKVKPVQSTEIKDKKIIREAIEQICKPISPASLKRHKKEEDDLIRLLKR